MVWDHYHRWHRVGGIVCFRRAQRLGIDGDTILDIAIPTVICGVIGARIYYVLTTLGEGRYHSFYDVIALWNGGLAIYGAVIGGGLAVFVNVSHQKNSLSFFG